MVNGIERQENTVVLHPGERQGRVAVPSSKSQLHRLLICAALGERPVAISYRGLSEDIAATVRCLNALGAKITVSEDGPQSVLHVSPLDRSSSPSGVELDCGESGSTLRFLLPVAGLLGADCTFVMQGRLSKRPLAEYGEQLAAHGMTLKQEGDAIHLLGLNLVKTSGKDNRITVSDRYIRKTCMELCELIQEKDQIEKWEREERFCQVTGRIG